ncbi:MAG: ATP-binding protein [Verrucomicrobiota bacterium]
MKYIERALEAKLTAYVESFPCTLVSGARQVGKSTLLDHLFGRQVRTFVFDPLEDLYGARQDPDLFLRNNPPPLILDEIQYAPELVPALKRAVDQDRRPGMYLITGSQQWEVMRHLAESLAGRVAIMELPSFSLLEQFGSNRMDWFPEWLEQVPKGIDAAMEMLGGFRSGGLSSTRLIWRGGFPEVQTLRDEVVPGWMRGYVGTYLQRDVRTLLEIRDETQFAAFLALCASLTAQECNYNHLGRDIGLSAPSAKRWIGVLRGTYQWLEIPAFSANHIKRLSGRPKGYFGDTGLACYLMRISSDQAVQGHPAFGALFETLVATEIHKRLQPMSLPPTLYHYRQHSGAEVDLIIEKDGLLFPVEIKSSARIHPMDARSISIFQEKMGTHAQAGLVVYAGEQVLRLGDRCIAVPFDLVGSP